MLKLFATCMDPQRAFLLLDDYLEKLSLSRKDFGQSEWWPRMQSSTGKPRLEEVAMLFLRNNRSLPTELLQHANFEKFAAVEFAGVVLDESSILKSFMGATKRYLVDRFAGTPTSENAPSELRMTLSSGVKASETPFESVIVVGA